MRILLIGATGTIGKAIAAALGGRHEVLLASRQQAPLRVDIADPASIRSLYSKVGKVGAVISAAGQARFKPLDELSDADFQDRKSTRLNSSHSQISYAVFCLKKKKKNHISSTLSSTALGSTYY